MSENFSNKRIILLALTVQLYNCTDCPVQVEGTLSALSAFPRKPEKAIQPVLINPVTAKLLVRFHKTVWLRISSDHQSVDYNDRVVPFLQKKNLYL